MKCQKCGANNANTHVKTVINGEIKEYDLCSECAKKMGYTNIFGNFEDEFSGLLGSFFGNSLPASGVHIENQLAIFDGIRFQPSGGDDLVLLHLLKHFYIIVSGRLEVNIQRSTFRHDVHIGITVFFTLIVFLYFCHIIRSFQVLISG